MKKYIQEIFPRLVKFSKTLDNLSILVDENWFVSTDDPSEQKIFVFWNNNDLLVSTNGVVERGRWDYIDNAKSLLIEFGDSMISYNRVFIDDKVLLLKQDGSDEIMILSNENMLIDSRSIEHYIEEEYGSKLVQD